MDLQQFKIGNVPSVYYVPDFLTDDEATSVHSRIFSSGAKWTVLSKRRLQNHGGLPNAKGMLAEPLADWLTAIGTKLNTTFTEPLFRKPPNHVLINEYEAGQGIMPHEDGPVYDPMVAIISLESGLILKFTEKSQASKSSNSTMTMDQQTEQTTSTDPDANAGNQFSVYLQPKSLIVFSHDVYENYRHGIEELTSDQIDETVINAREANVPIGQSIPRSLRVSLTFRVVKKTLKKNFIRL